MSYRREDYIKVNELLAKRRGDAEAEARARLYDAYERMPELREVDKTLARTSAKIAAAIAGGRDEIEARIAEIEAENMSLQRRRAQILVDNGYPADYTEPRYFCRECGDTGFVGSRECSCRRRALITAGYESSGIGELLRTQTFETFSLSYNGEFPSTARNLETVKRYAESFTGDGDGSLLLVGSTGLGKTHLSSSAARVVIERGFDVFYIKSQNMMSLFEDHQFRRERADEDAVQRCFDCDLLIIDDLGTEVSNGFTNAMLYNVVDTRISRRKGMIINTNLSAAELRKRYADRITSRLFGEFTALLFEGRDVRAEKLR